MKEDIVCSKLIEILECYLIDVEWRSIRNDDELTEFGMDSMIFIQMVVDIEAKFNIEIPDEYLLIEKMDTINKIIDVIFDLME